MGDGQVPNTGTSDTSYGSSDEGIALANGMLYFANTGNDALWIVPSLTSPVRTTRTLPRPSSPWGRTPRPWR